MSMPIHPDTQSSRVRAAGFTLVELLIAVSLMILVVTVALSAMSNILRSDMRITNHMRMVAEGQRMADFLRGSTRLTSSSEIVLFPEEGPHYAVSYPVPSGVGEVGNEELNFDGSVVWGETLIVHAWPADDPEEVRLTRFRPRENDLTPAQRFQQLESVAQNGNGSGAMNGSNSSTQRLARVKGTLSFRTEGQSYNFHSSSDLLDSAVNLGGVRLQPGNNSLRFQVEGKSSASGGHGMKIDRIFLSPAGIPLEAEALLPVSSQSGAVAQVEEREGLLWSDGRALSFPASSAGAFFEVDFFNDTWHETKFVGRGSEFENAMTFTSFEEGDTSTRLRPTGRDLAWYAMFQAGEGEGIGTIETNLQGRTVRILVRGKQAVGGPQVLADGDGCTVEFEAATQESAMPLVIGYALISEAGDPANPGPDIDPATSKQLLFGDPDSPSQWIFMYSGEKVRTVPVDFPIDQEKSYVITYYFLHVPPASDGRPSGQLRKWGSETSPIDTFILPDSVGSINEELHAANWSDRSGLSSRPGIYGVTEIQTTYVNKGIYTSRVVDTTLAAPEFKDIAWSEITPPDTSVEFQIRTGQSLDMQNASNWENVNVMTSPGNVFFTGNQFVQVRFILKRDPVHDQIPELRNFTLRWMGEETNLDFGGVFHRFPSGGIAEVFVNEEPPSASFRAEFNMSGNATAFSGDKPSWDILVETSPRN
jgi:hypothetical protein